MDSFSSFILRKLYRKVNKLGDRLAEVEPLIDWEKFRPTLQDIYNNDGPQGGRPNTDPVLMVKMLVLHQWYGLSDPELERQAADRISFRRFLGYPDVIPDSITVWLFRERLAETGRYKDQVDALSGAFEMLSRGGPVEVLGAKRRW
jgi:IS5 family transposase